MSREAAWGIIAFLMMTSVCGCSQDPDPVRSAPPATFPDLGSSGQDLAVVDLSLVQRPDASTPPAPADMAQPVDMRQAPDLAMTPDMSQQSCAKQPAWDGVTPAFRELAGVFGPGGLDAQGTRIAVADLDDDGWPDVVVRRASDKALEHVFDPPGIKQVWVLRNKGDGSFEDITASSNLLARRDQAQGVGRPAEIFVFGDVDGDGDVDAFTAFSNSDPAALHPATAEIMLNRGGGVFELGPEGSDVRRPEPGAYSRGGASFTDIDRDGSLDVWVGTGAAGQDILYKGDGAGSFVNQTAMLGLLTKPWSLISDLNQALAHTTSWGVNACDLNNDGTPELLSASYGRAPNHLWQGRQEAGAPVTYLNRSIPSGYAFDARQDWQDNESARCHCQLNPQDAGCAGVPSPTSIPCQSAKDVFRWDHQYDREPFRLGGNSGTTVCADVNNDGWLDLLTSEIVHWDVGASSDPSELLINSKQPEVSFARPGPAATGLTRTHTVAGWNDGDITAAAFDFDNDGRQDIYIGSNSYPGTRGLLYHQQADGTFVPVPIDVGIDHKSSHGLAVADVDRDGDLDLIVGHARSRCSSGNHCYPSAHVRLFENQVGAARNWVQLDLRGAPGTNRLAIGARVVVKAKGMMQVQEVGGGHGHYGIQHDRVVHFGLGEACEAQVEVTWPDKARTTQTFSLRAGKRYRVLQGAQPEVIDK